MHTIPKMELEQLSRTDERAVRVNRPQIFPIPSPSANALG